jgi:hypothetical protein
MNKTEQRYAMHLEVMKRAGEIVKYGYESIKLILAPNTSYTPDFYVVCADGSMEFHEVKGFWEDDSRVKFKVAADKFPEYGFVAITERTKKEGGGYKYEVLNERQA